MPGKGGGTCFRHAPKFFYPPLVQENQRERTKAVETSPLVKRNLDWGAARNVKPIQDTVEKTRSIETGLSKKRRRHPRTQAPKERGL